MTHCIICMQLFSHFNWAQNNSADQNLKEFILCLYQGFSSSVKIKSQECSRNFRKAIYFFLGVPFRTKLVYMGFKKCIQSYAVTTKILSTLIIANITCPSHNLRWTVHDFDSPDKPKLQTYSRTFSGHMHLFLRIYFNHANMKNSFNTPGIWSWLSWRDPGEKKRKKRYG